jgi:hypothetical protein
MKCLFLFNMANLTLSNAEKVLDRFKAPPEEHLGAYNLLRTAGHRRLNTTSGPIRLEYCSRGRLLQAAAREYERAERIVINEVYAVGGCDAYRARTPPVQQGEFEFLVDPVVVFRKMRAALKSDSRTQECHRYDQQSTGHVPQVVQKATISKPTQLELQLA